ncbi:uncharacterized [Tachysurus ichikawai]
MGKREKLVQLDQQDLEDFKETMGCQGNQINCHSSFRRCPSEAAKHVRQLKDPQVIQGPQDPKAQLERQAILADLEHRDTQDNLERWGQSVQKVCKVLVDWMERDIKDPRGLQGSQVRLVSLGNEVLPGPPVFATHPPVIWVMSASRVTSTKDPAFSELP